MTHGHDIAQAQRHGLSSETSSRTTATLWLVASFNELFQLQRGESFHNRAQRGRIIFCSTQNE
ncbi:uncharacterized protein SPAPADRAFT_62349 [Spathaspora passalidarum NRRL Y-27907]|uniref:Uncharacterized protein n=1 Tax=Spathaspora passalidarum (strain NRRL Y-27907 / 11-Y1) TaxID=619300 RepID=G3ARE8_SPAPN|nr:uncharacterized protein SPAPADRAFT_62349 [Spathaspora passalidarum NRRL Y-27907]EGW31755.1 hypothetical protein SPAPADRAFT_62349 [Spathaspora passalidarum NRRL Y-27907]